MEKHVRRLGSCRQLDRVILGGISNRFTGVKSAQNPLCTYDIVLLDILLG
jgi:hypothetical protein